MFQLRRHPAPDQRSVTTWLTPLSILLVGVLLVSFATPSLAQRSGSVDQVEQSELHKEGALKDLSFGKADAPVTIVEYASLTCGHCANFYTQEFPKIKEKYIDTGKARMIKREFPLNARAYAASMITRCVSEGARPALVGGLFETQKDWAFKRTNQEFKQALFDFTKQAGLSQDEFNKCLGNDELLTNLTTQFKKGSEDFGVDATPAFFVNGKRLRGAPVMDNFEKAIEAALGGQDGETKTE